MAQENSATTKSVIKSGIVRDVGSIMAVILLITDGIWMYRFFSGSEAVLAVPLPDYDHVLGAIHVLRIVLCLICFLGFFKPRHIFWVIFQYAFFVYQCSAACLTTVYFLYYGYMAGPGIADALMMLSGMPLLIVVFLLLIRRGDLPQMALCGMIILDLVFYFLGSWFYDGIEIFNPFFPFQGFWLKSALAALLIAFCCCFGGDGASNPA